MGAPSRRLQHQMSVLREDNPGEAVTLENVAAYVKLLVEKRLVSDVKKHLHDVRICVCVCVCVCVSE